MGEEEYIKTVEEMMTIEQIDEFKTTIVKKVRYLLYTMWYTKGSRKIYTKHNFNKNDFIWYTKDGAEKLSINGNNTTIIVDPGNEKPKVENFTKSKQKGKFSFKKTGSPKSLKGGKVESPKVEKK